MLVYSPPPAPPESFGRLVLTSSQRSACCLRPRALFLAEKKQGVCGVSAPEGGTYQAGYFTKSLERSKRLERPAASWAYLTGFRLLNASLTTSVRAS